jgi:hypothetical protein
VNQRRGEAIGRQVTRDNRAVRSATNKAKGGKLQFS